jgi:hypothetical protein
MSKRSFEMYQYRQVLLLMRKGDSDREIARDGLMGRAKCKALRELAAPHGWLEASTPLPDDAALAATINTKPRPAPCVSTLEPYCAEIERWIGERLQGTTIHAALQRKHGYRGSYSAVRRFLQAHAALQPVATTMRLDFAPGDAAQVDFGAGPLVPDPRTGELKQTWIFVMTLCWSRHPYAELVHDQSVTTCPRASSSTTRSARSRAPVTPIPRCNTALSVIERARFTAANVLVAQPRPHLAVTFAEKRTGLDHATDRLRELPVAELRLRTALTQGRAIRLCRTVFVLRLDLAAVSPPGLA